MFNHISIGVRDIVRAKKFYDAALKPLGLKCLSEDAASRGEGRDIFASTTPPSSRDLVPGSTPSFFERQGVDPGA